MRSESGKVHRDSKCREDFDLHRLNENTFYC